MSWSPDAIYVQRNGKYDLYTFRPNLQDTIESHPVYATGKN